MFKNLLSQAVGITLITIGVTSAVYGTNRAWDLFTDHLDKK